VLLLFFVLASVSSSPLEHSSPKKAARLLPLRRVVGGDSRRLSRWRLASAVEADAGRGPGKTKEAPCVVGAGLKVPRARRDTWCGAAMCLTK
jgi:hypothetical protein